MEVVDRTADRLIEADLLGEHTSVLWHAGEPMVVPQAFYRRAIGILSAKLGSRTTLHNALQTNATLIDHEWCHFLKEHCFDIGVSLDGPVEYHDDPRRFRSGRGSHAATMAGIGMLKQHGIPFGVICVLTQRSLANPEPIIDFLLSIGAESIGFNVEESEGCHVSRLYESLGLIDRFRFFVDLLWRKAQGSPVRIREFESVRRSILRTAPTPVNDQAAPFQIVSVDVKGGLATFSPELLTTSNVGGFGTFVLGNVLDASIAEMIASEKYGRLAADISTGVSQCLRSCAYYRFCGGGAPSNKLAEHGSATVTATMHCKLIIQQVAEAVVSGYENIHGNESAMQ